MYEIIEEGNEKEVRGVVGKEYTIRLSTNGYEEVQKYFGDLDTVVQANEHFEQSMATKNDEPLYFVPQEVNSEVNEAAAE